MKEGRKVGRGEEKERYVRKREEWKKEYEWRREEIIMMTILVFQPFII